MNNGTQSKKIRSFIALELSDEAREELARIETSLKEADADVKWVRPEAIHLTLKFLGYIPEEKISKIGEALNRLASSTKPFDITLSEIGTFPRWSQPRVLWVGLGEGDEMVKSLAQEVEEAMAPQGFEKEKRPFSAHLTLGRVKSPKNKNKLEEIASLIKVKPSRTHIEKVVLFQSHLSPEGAAYTQLIAPDLTG